ncbi:MAG: AAA family ATPase [Myxococcota bacterium]
MSDTMQDNPIVNPSGKIPVGVSDFAKLRQEGYCFVDKTLFIKEFLDIGAEVTLITRPRRFGKTINLDMLCRFLRRPASDKEDLFEGLAISQAGRKYQQERGKRPVLFISLRAVKQDNWDDGFWKLRNLLADLVEETCKDAPVDQLSSGQQRILKRVTQEQASSVECEKTLLILTKLLTLKHNGVAPWVAVDEYDAPMQAAYQYNYYKQMRNLMKGLLGDCLKDGRFLHQAVLTGILRVAKEDIFSELNNPGIYGVLDQPYASWFGFTEHEVNQLLQQREHSERLELVRQAYNGYRFGADQPLMIYNPWSVINDLGKPTSQPGLHWVNTSDNHLVHRLLTQADTEIKKGLHELLSATTQHATTQIVQEHVPLREVVKDNKNLWGLLLASGYLTAAHARENPDADNKIVQLCIPNNEVRRLYSGLVNRWLRGLAQGISGTAVVDVLLKGEIQEFAEEFQEFVLESVSFFDTGGKQPERFYHAFVLGMLQHLRDRYIIESEQTSGLGRYDLALEPKDKSQLGFVFEFKRALQAESSLQASAQKALQQIQQLQYHTNLFKRGVQRVIALGMAFKHKQVAIAHTELTQ